MKETTEAITWLTEGKPGDFSPQKRKKQLQGKKTYFFSFQLAGTFKIRARKLSFIKPINKGKH